MNEDDLFSFNYGLSSPSIDGDLGYHKEDHLRISIGPIGLQRADFGSTSLYEDPFMSLHLFLGGGLFYHLFGLDFHRGGDLVSSIRFFKVENFK